VNCVNSDGDATKASPRKPLKPQTNRLIASAMMKICKCDRTAIDLENDLEVAMTKLLDVDKKSNQKSYFWSMIVDGVELKSCLIQREISSFGSSGLMAIGDLQLTSRQRDEC
jgi:hypothetical protein